MLTCPACGNANPDGSRFCNHCGARLQPAATASGLRPYTPRHLVEQVLNTRDAQIGERKRVTVLFADIKGSTRLAEEAGAEAWHEILDRYFGLLAAAVHRYEGTVNQYTGDGIMALFGAPIAHEDHAQRACLAALEMQREVRAYADELRLSAALNLTMRIGLNTGEVVVGSIGDDLRMDYTAQGHTVNLAARMEHICEPGRIYCSRTTAALVEGYFRLRDLGETAVEGASAPVRVFELEGAGPIQSRLQRALARGAARFIGRESELHVLQRALERACAGAPGIVAVVGAAGVGKSRLCHEFALSCTRQGVTVHRAAGVPYASALPLHPLLTLLRSRFGIGPETNAWRAACCCSILRQQHNCRASSTSWGWGTALRERRRPAAIAPSCSVSSPDFWSMRKRRNCC
jgi:class 3 adenylate cyclase